MQGCVEDIDQYTVTDMLLVHLFSIGIICMGIIKSSCVSLCPSLQRLL